MRTILLSFIVTLLAACADKDAELSVSVTTGLVAGPEFNVVETALVTSQGDIEFTSRAAERSASVGEPFARGVVVATFAAVPQGEWTVRVRLRRPDGTLLVQRRLTLSLTGDRSVTVPITRDCVGVMCPGAGSAAFTECLAGRCVDPRCDPSDPQTLEYCPEIEFCNAPSECGEPAACARNICTDGVCQTEPIDDGESNACELTHQWCNPERGCEALPEPARDAGVRLDAGDELDAAVVDGGPTRTCERCFGVRLDDGDEILVCEPVPCPDLGVRDGGRDGGGGSESDSGPGLDDAFVSDAHLGADAFTGSDAGARLDSGSALDLGDVPSFDAAVDAGPLDSAADAPVDASALCEVCTEYPGKTGWTRMCEMRPCSLPCAPEARVRGYRDVDGDGYGTLVGDYLRLSSAIAFVCPGTVGYAAQAGDCDDSNPSVHPDAREACDGVDNDCDYVIDGAPADGDCDANAYCQQGSCTTCTEITTPVSGTILTSGVWCSPTDRIVVDGDLLIRQDVAVSIAPGTELAVGDGVAITVRGILDLHGRADAPVVMQSSALSPTRGSWDGISLENGGTTPWVVAHHATIRHAAQMGYGANGEMRFVDSRFELNDQLFGGMSWPLTLRTTFDDNTLIGPSTHVDGTLTSNGTACMNCMAYRSAFTDNLIALRGSCTLLDSAVSGNDVALQMSSTSSGALIAFSSIVDNATLLDSGSAMPALMRYDTIRGNGSGLVIDAPMLEGDVDGWAGNTICDNDGDYLVRLSSISDAYVRGNYWCTTDESALNAAMYDYRDDGALGEIRFTPMLSAPDPLAPAYEP